MTVTVTLDQLCISPRNCRRNHADAFDTADLEASISSEGLIYPLLIHPMAEYRAEALPGEPDAPWGVLAGGRRLRALRKLVEAGTLPPGYPVKVEVKNLSPGPTILLSLRENFGRRDLRPYETQAAIVRAGADGMEDEEIARELGQTLVWVHRQQRLGRLIFEIFEAYAAGDISGDQAQAFAATEDHDLQRAAWAHFAPLRDWDRGPHRIRAWYRIGDHELERLLRFVSHEDYHAAGGRYELDLFADGPERGRVTDEGLLRELAEHRLSALRTGIRSRTGREALRFAAEPPQQHGSADLSLLIEPEMAKGGILQLPEGDVIATVDIDAAGEAQIRYWWASARARREAMRTPAGDQPQMRSAPRTSFGHTITGAEAFDRHSSHARTARAAVKDEHGLTADGLQVMRSLRRELLRALMVTDAAGGGTIGRDYILWSQLRQELDNDVRAARAGTRGLASAWNDAAEAEPHDVVEPHVHTAPAHELWSATLDHVRSLPAMTLADPDEAFAAWYFESERTKNVAAAVLAGLALLRSANVPGWRVPVHDRIARILGAEDAMLRELWQPTPAFMALFPKLKRLELAQPYVDPEAFKSWHRQSDQILTGACAHALEGAEGWVHPLLSFGLPAGEARSSEGEAPAGEVMTAQCEEKIR